ncbi:flavodoxin family protein [Methanosphaera sp. WGK6]|uniref:flavodoxin family protein n=1 Tax=Methanosphaera sp. WGK6 TaxID=1561964 RepID=UPI00084C72A8|nr:flavodoxin family protein [Methanosphaera sp. WGK6]OED30413.1 flavodoxin [Methanosphaera sp. WGK6]
MKFYAVNGSPRGKNTSELISKTIDGLKDELVKNGVDTSSIEIEEVDLYKINFKGCMSCFSCKLIDGPFYGTCPINDDLKELLEDIWNADGLVIGSPIYFGHITGETQSFIERLLFPKMVYGGENLLKKNIPTGLIITMNVQKEMSDELYENSFKLLENYLKNIIGDVYRTTVYDTYQFDDYSKYENYLFDPEAKAKQHAEEYPKDLEAAYEMGQKIAVHVLKQ